MLDQEERGEVECAAAGTAVGAAVGAAGGAKWWWQEMQELQGQELQEPEPQPQQ